MVSINRFSRISAFVAAAVIALAPASLAANRYRRFTVTGISPENPTTGDEGVEITHTGPPPNSCTVNFPAGITSNGAAAQEIIDQCTGAGFTITRVGSRVTVCHPGRRPKLRKVNIANKRTTSSYSSTALRSDNLIECRGVATGGGVVSVWNGTLQAQVPTTFGQTAEEIVDLLVEQFDAQTDFGSEEWSFGAEYTAAAFGLPPLDSADLGIYQLGPLDLNQTEFFSSDPGIELFQEAGPQAYPTSCAGDIGPCGCGNVGASGEGCANSTGTGALLAGAGNASLSNDSFDLLVTQTPNQPGLLFQGEFTIDGGLPFGDGMRCCGGHILRLGTYLPAAHATSLLDGNRIDGPVTPVSQHPGNAALQPGDTRCYQWWHRDPGPSNPCQQNYFNLSNSIEATWGA